MLSEAVRGDGAVQHLADGHLLSAAETRGRPSAAATPAAAAGGGSTRLPRAPTATC